MTPEAEHYWDSYCRAAGISDQATDAFSFGDSPELADELLQLVLEGRKRATCALHRFYGDENPLPTPGSKWVVLDGKGAPRCIIETTETQIKPVREVDAAFAFDEGEGDRSLKYWIAEHTKFFEREAVREGFDYHDSMDAVFERFRVVWPPNFAD